ncbi:transporter substrate-binding domain-containing protein [Desulfuromonas sp. TF]|uniref:transporter substrate-binding domain-containing protein n=1 Tax=Desulfuromonas sp. TF TaxID=1232410 RepID=UPI00041AD606|nr:transporter substrate-binding domain-containing protein [Desulfuromonas sp. TF]
MAEIFPKNPGDILFRPAVLLCLLLTVAIPALAREKPEEPILFGGDSSFAPFEYLDDQDEPAGFDIDILRAVAEVMGLKVEIRLGPWSTMRSRLEEGRIDALAGMRYSEERDLLLDFSAPYLINTSAIFVRKDSAIRTFDDLKGKEILVQRGDIMDDFLRETPLSSHIVFVDDQIEALRLLASGKHDAALCTRLAGLYLIHHHGLDNLKITGVDFSGGSYGFAVTEANTELLARLDEGLRILKSTGRYEAIYERWFGLYEKKSVFRELLRYAIWILGPTLLLLATAVVWSWTLRRQVAAKTRQISEHLSERQRMEAALESEREFRQFVEASPVPMAITDQNLTILYVNRKFTELFGYTIGDLPDLGTWWSQLSSAAGPHPDSREGKSPSFDPGFSAHDCGELKVFDRDGAPLTVECRFSSIEERHFVVFNDVTDRKRAEEALAYRAEIEELVSSIVMRFVNLAPEEVDGAIDRALGEIGKFIGVDRSYVFQFSEDGTRMDNTNEWCAPSIEPHISRLQGLPTESLPWYMNQISGGEAFYCPSVDRLGPEAQAEKEEWRREGIKSLITVPMLYKGRMVGFVGFDSVRTEQCWPKSVPFLLRMVGEGFAGAIERRRMEKELRVAHREMEAFVYTVSHDLRSHLTPIIGFADFLETGYRGKLDEQALSCLSSIGDSGNRMLEVMEDLLALASVGKLEMPDRPVNARAVVQEVVDNLASRLAAAGISVTIAELPHLRVPRTVLSRIFDNLIGNALRYAGPEGGPIEVGGERREDAVVFHVSDHGPGIPDKERQRIFEAFYRGSTKGNAVGTGIGLAIVQKSAHLYGGRAWAEETPGGGATIRVEMKDVCPDTG